MMEPSDDVPEIEATAVPPPPSSVGHELSPLPSSPLPPPMLDSDRPGSTKPSPIETRRLKARGFGASPSSLVRDKRLRDKGGADQYRGGPNTSRPAAATAATASRTTSGDDYQSLCASVSTLNTALSSPPSTPNTVATSYFDEPSVYGGSDVAPSRAASLPVKGFHRRGGPLSRSDSADSESAVTVASAASQQPPARILLQSLKRATFPIHMRPMPPVPPLSPRHLGFGHHQPQQYQQPHYHASSNLRSSSDPAPSSPVPERDSGLGDETDDTDEMEAIELTESTGGTMHDFDTTSQDSMLNDYADKDVSLPDSLDTDPVLIEARPNEGLIEDLCNYVLQRAFNTELSEIHGRSDAWEVVARCWHELSRIIEAEENHNASACDGSEAPSCGASSASGSGSGSGGGHSGNGNGGGRKRANQYTRDNDGSSGDGFNADGSGGDDDGRSGDGAGMSSKKLKVVEADQKFSCPYRKRNPLRFNVRDHQTCANQPYTSMANLKRHVKTFHKHIPKGTPQTVCPRCKEPLPSQEALEYHLMRSTESMCAPREDSRVPHFNSHIDPEDGISNAVETILNGRKNNHKVDTWEGLWRTLFPRDEEVKDYTFAPPIELDEVQNEFEQDPAQLSSRIFQAFQDDPRFDHDALLSFTRRTDAVCQGYIRDTLIRCRLNLENSGSSTSSRRRRLPTARATPRSPGSARHTSFSHEPPLNPQLRARLPLLIPSTPAAALASTGTSNNGNNHHQTILMDPVTTATQTTYPAPVSTHDEHTAPLSAFAQEPVLNNGVQQGEAFFTPVASSHPFNQIPRTSGAVEVDLEPGLLEPFGFATGYAFAFPHSERSMALLQASMAVRTENGPSGGSPGWETLDTHDIAASHTGFHHLEGAG